MYQIDFQHPIHVYFCGIGGISMSGLAEILKSKGFRVSGSDRDESAVTRHLRDNGIPVYTPQKAENITDDIDLVVFTAAIHEDNPEYIAVSEKKIPFLSRAELLGEMMKNYTLPVAIAGTHGKTTTTAMVSDILLQAEKLVEVVPRKGTYARSINRSEVVDMYELRKLIEPAIIEKYLTNIDLQKLEILDQKLKETLESEPQDDRKFNELDIAFHRFLASASRCQRIIATLEPALQESYRVSMYNNLNGTSNSLERTYQQHHDVVSAIIAENRGRAKEALLVHLNASLFSSLASLNT